MNIDTIIGVTDFSTQGDAALDRAAMLALAHRATLEVMCLPSGEEAKGSSAAVRLTYVARQLAQRHDLVVRPIAQVAHSLAHLAEQAAGADLVVLPATRGHVIRTMLSGSVAERLLRLSACPVLVVKGRPRRRYERILVAVDFTAHGQALAELGARIEPDSGITLFHALGTQIETRLRSSDVSPDIISSMRERDARDGRDRLGRFADGMGAHRGRILQAIGRGDPGHQVAVRQRRDGADLTVVGKHRGSTFTDLLFGSVAHQVLRQATGDVLVVPHDFQLARQTVPARRASRGRDDAGFALATAQRSAA